VRWGGGAAGRGAHSMLRVHTQGYERVLVMAEGRVVEDGAMQELGRQPDSLFARLAAQAHAQH